MVYTIINYRSIERPKRTKTPGIYQNALRLLDFSIKGMTQCGVYRGVGGFPCVAYKNLVGIAYRRV